MGWEEAGARLGRGCGEAARRLGGGWEEAGRRLGGGCWRLLERSIFEPEIVGF